MTKFVTKFIQLYQKFLSPDHSFLKTSFLLTSGCRYFPTCSQYAYQSIQKYGILKGSFLAFKRIIRCHPFSPGGYDPIP